MAKAEKAAPEAAEKKSKVSRGVNKSAEDTAERSERARKYPASMKIKFLNKENPHRETSGRAAAFAALLTCKTVGDYYETGHKVKYLKDWAEKYQRIEALGSPDAE